MTDLDKCYDRYLFILAKCGCALPQELDNRFAFLDDNKPGKKEIGYVIA